MKHRGCRLVVPAVLALAVLCFSPPAFGADSASLASLGPSVGNSQSTGGGFERLIDLPETIPGGVLGKYQRSDKIGVVDGIPVRAYFTGRRWEKVGSVDGRKNTRVVFNKYIWVDADGINRGEFVEAVDVISDSNSGYRNP